MEPTSQARLYTCAFLTGALLHIGIFRFGEWDRAYHKAGFAYVVTAAMGSFCFSNYEPFRYTFTEATTTTLCLELFSIAGIFSSMIVYRTFFHPLRNFPGPFWARFSKLYTLHLAKRSKPLFEEIQALYAQYGDFIRVGPTEISILDVTAVEKLHGPKTTCSKGPWYDVDPMKSLHNTRNREEHRQRRRVWDHAFTGQALLSYESRVMKYTQQLLNQIENHYGTSMDASRFFNYYSFDIMGDLAFGDSFNMTKEGRGHYYMKALHDFMDSVGFLTHVIWLAPLLRSIPLLGAEASKFWQWTENQVQRRRLNPPNQPDIFSWILQGYEAKQNPSKRDTLGLIGDANLIAVAGSDATAATLACLFYELAMCPEAQREIQEEIGSQRHDTDVHAVDLSKSVHLTGAIKETLRLHPAVPSGLQRLTPPEGIRIGTTFVPGNTIVQVPTHTLHRDKRNFVRPDDFLPGRWKKGSDLVLNPRAFTPFSTGPYSCIGKQLAWMELRTVTANVLKLYDVRFAPGFSAEAFLKSKRDSFTLAVGALELVFVKRSHSA